MLHRGRGRSALELNKVGRVVLAVDDRYKRRDDVQQPGPINVREKWVFRHFRVAEAARRVVQKTGNETLETWKSSISRFER